MAQDLRDPTLDASGDRGRAHRINPDSIVTLWFTVGLVCFLAVASFMVSFTGLHEVAAWAGLPVWLRWAVPVFIDVAILAYTMAVLIHRHRGERTWASWVSLGGFTLFSVVANGAHALSVEHPDEVQRIIGAAVAALAPVAVFAATEQLGRLVIRRPDPKESPESLPTVTQTGRDVSRGFPADDVPSETEKRGTAQPVDEEPVVGQDSDSPALSLPPVPEATVAANGISEKVSASQVQDTAMDAGLDGGTRPVLSVVGRKPKPADFEAWIRGVVAAGKQPTGRDAADFLGVSERTGRARLTTLRTSNPGLFEAAILKKGTSS
ncbi:DUF2637 domain-containing protein [Paenarthrobacter sp. C1]|uniref:DUF2637 domain-containing protein n=1 Tax=Paenarthrobacter sp. C1 TaxID=3400220 RepID=UPI003BF5C26D